jgi:polyisoprenoid-binding protein YceI
MGTTRWGFDLAHSNIQFTARHMVISKVRGVFSRWNGALDYDEKDPTASSVSVRIEAASLDTHEEKRDAHLRSADFFEVDRFPEITFQSRRVERHAEALRITGDLTLHGVTREVVLDGEYLGAAKDPWGHQRIGFSAKASINRKDFGLTWNQALETGGLLVGEKIDIAIDVEAIAA